MNTIIRKICAFIIVTFVATSCVTQKQLTYLHNVDSTHADSINAKFTPRTETILRPGDALTVFITAWDKEAVAPYNLPTVVYAAPGSSQVQTTPMLQYYIVDEKGDVTMPVLGAIHVAGLTRVEAQEAIRALLETQVVNPSVQVNLINAKVSVLGEVNRPGYVGMSGDRLTILEALAAAGDLTPYGKRDDVLVTREVDGKLEMARVDLRSADLYNSPFFYLQQNDVIYVSPNKVRAVSSANAGLWLSMVSTVASAATVIVTVVNVARPASTSTSK